MQSGIVCISFTGRRGGDVSRFGSRSVGTAGATASPWSDCPMDDMRGGIALIRMALFVVAGLALAVPAAWAQSTAPESDDSRYTFNRIDDGYLRLDGRTGQVSI